MNNIKYHFETSQGTYKRDRAQSEIQAQKEYEYWLRVQARATLVRLRAEGKRISVHYSNSYDVANRGIVVMPIPRLLSTGHLAWSVR
jgi:hypothetical protein